MENEKDWNASVFDVEDEEQDEIEAESDPYIMAEAFETETAEQAAEAVKTSGWLKEFYEWTQAIAIAVVLALIINQFLFAIVQVEGGSMLPTLENKERLIVTKLFYKPQVHDIVIIKSSALRKHIVKRVIALPGQEVYIDAANGDVFVDGELQDEPFIKEKIAPSRVGTLYDYPFVVPEGHVFVMGDNRNNSQDSRSIGVIPYSEIVGKASLRILPLRRFGGLYHDLPDEKK